MDRRPVPYPEGQREPSGWVAAVNALLAVVILLVVLQLWLLTVSLDTFLGGQPAETVGLAALSGVAFLLCLGALLVARR